MIRILYTARSVIEGDVFDICGSCSQFGGDEEGGRVRGKLGVLIKVEELDWSEGNINLVCRSVDFLDCHGYEVVLRRLLVDHDNSHTYTRELA